MLKFNFKYEFKQLLRSKWLQLLSVLLLILFGFATYNGVKKVDDRTSVIAKAQAEVQESDEQMTVILDSLDRGLEVSLQPWYLPNNPMVVGNNYPRLASMPPADFTFIATGQSDMYAHYKTPKVSRDGLVADFTEMTSPVQLLFGSFDLAFVLIYLLPLLIITFSYNVLSAEREAGTLRLLASQPIGIRTWVLQKLLLRFFWLSVIVIVSLAVVLLVFGTSPFENIGTLLSVFGLVLAYMLFWFGLAFLVNLWVSSSAKNAVAMLGLWVGFVLLVPSVLNQLGSSVYPIPSRALMINEVRTMQAEATKKQDEILDNYLRDHPEYAVNDSTQQRTFWHGYMASQQLLREEVQPVLNNYDLQLQRQQEWINRFKWLSPAVTVQESLNKIAGTSSTDYDNYRTQVLAFSDAWRQHLMPYLYNNTAFAKADIEKLPAFNYKYESYSGIASLVILGIAVGLFGIGFLVTGKKSSSLIKN